MPQKSNIQALGDSLRRVSEQKAIIPDVRPASPEPVKLGRKKRLLINRDNAISVYCTDEMMSKITEVRYNSRVEQSRLVQAAVDLFLSKYYNESTQRLTPEGIDLVNAFERKITIYD